MRIIAGKFRGRKILDSTDKKTRPLKDLVKESIFNVIVHSKKFDLNLENSTILDLFSGVGSFGLEALSRAADSVIFVENYPVCLSILKKNIENLNLGKRCKIVEKDILKDLNFNIFKKKFNIIFLDPPYKDKNFNYVLELIYNQDILEKNGVIIVHRHKNDPIDLSKNFKLVEEKKYGISKIFFLNI